MSIIDRIKCALGFHEWCRVVTEESHVAREYDKIFIRYRCNRCGYEEASD